MIVSTSLASPDTACDTLQVKVAPFGGFGKVLFPDSVPIPAEPAGAEPAQRVEQHRIPQREEPRRLTERLRADHAQLARRVGLIRVQLSHGRRSDRRIPSPGTVGSAIAG